MISYDNPTNICIPSDRPFLPKRTCQPRPWRHSVTRGQNSNRAEKRESGPWIADHCVIFRNRRETFWIWQGTLQRGEFWLLSTTLHHRWASVQASHRDQTWRSFRSSSVTRLWTLLGYIKAENFLPDWIEHRQDGSPKAELRPERLRLRLEAGAQQRGREKVTRSGGQHLTLMHIFDSWTSVYPTPYQQYDIAYAKLPNNNLSLYSDLIWGWT